MSDALRSRTITAIAVVAAGLAACEAFAPQSSIRASDAISRSQNSLVCRNALFGLFGTEEKTTETSANGGVMDAFSPLNSKNLIEKTKYIIDNKGGFYCEADPDVFAEDFVFRGPQVGPLNKKDYVATINAFSLHKSFPDIKSNAWGFSLDPENPNRVWFMVRNTGTFTGEPLLPELLNVQPNGAKVEGPPETFSVLYDEDQKIKYLTVGYVADRFDGNTGGRGAAYGFFEIIGIGLPSSGPLLRALQWFNSEVMRTPPLSYSTDVPEWFLKEKGTDRGDEGYGNT